MSRLGDREGGEDPQTMAAVKAVSIPFRGQEVRRLQRSDMLTILCDTDASCYGELPWGMNLQFLFRCGFLGGYGMEIRTNPHFDRTHGIYTGGGG